MESCQKSPKSFTLVNNVFLHVLILFTILSALFILYISKLTTDGINKEFINIVNNAFSPTELSKIDSNEILKQNLKNIDPIIFSTYINQFNNYPNDLREEINLKIKEEIFCNSIITHGHPRAILGAMLYGYAVNQIIVYRPEDFNWENYITQIGLDFPKKFELSFVNKMEIQEWLKEWNKSSNKTFERSRI